MYKNKNKNKKYKFTFLFYDYETFGKDPALDRAAQFACIKTDINLNIIHDTQSFYCSIPNDYLPNPHSVLLHGITPQYTVKNGKNEFYFSKKIYDLFNTGNTCIVGYNNINFDDEFTRNIFYRNFFDIYSWSWKNNNSRWDLINIIRACYVLSPEGIQWPKNKRGFVSFKLNDLVKANNINHAYPHDALYDVYATLGLARLIKNKKSKLFNFFFKYRLKNNIKLLINTMHDIPLIYISGFFGNLKKNMAFIFPIFWNKSNFNMLVFFNLDMDINLLISFLRQDKKNINFQILFNLGLNFLYINKCPILIPINILKEKKKMKLGINISIYSLKIYIIRSNIHLFKKVDIFFKNYVYKNNSNNVDMQIYASFFNLEDKKKIQMINHISLKNIDSLKKINLYFSDYRLNEMLFRYRARNFLNYLNDFEKKQWTMHLLNIFNKKFLKKYYLNLVFLIDTYSSNFYKINLLYSLLDYMDIYFMKKLKF